MYRPLMFSRPLTFQTCLQKDISGIKFKIDKEKRI